MKGKANLVSGRRGLWGRETSKAFTFLNNWLTDGGEVVSVKNRPPFEPRKFRSTHFCYRLSRAQGHNAADRFGISVRKYDELLGMAWPKIHSKVTQLREAALARMKPEDTPYYFAIYRSVCSIGILLRNNTMVYLTFCHRCC
jgi:hypothetical protein